MARVVFLGTPEYAAVSLRALIAAGHEVMLAVSQPDKARGRGLTVAETPVAQAARELGVPTLQPATLKDESARAALLAALSAADVGIVVAYGRIIPRALLAAPSHGLLNAHGSLLPLLRGAAPIQWALALGFTESGITLQRMVYELDAGDIVAQRSGPIAPEDDAAALFARYAQWSAELIVDTLPNYLAGRITPQAQDPTQATFAPLLTRAHGEVDFTQPATTLVNRIRGFSPRPGQWARTDNGALVRFALAEAWSGNDDGIPPFFPIPPGTVLAVVAKGEEGSCPLDQRRIPTSLTNLASTTTGGAWPGAPTGIYLACGAGVLRVVRVQAENRREMSAAEYLRGASIRVGAVWHAPGMASGSPP